MYKVFIENKPVIFKINPDLKKKNRIVKKQVWKEIQKGLKRKKSKLVFEIKNKGEFFKIFEDYKYIIAAGGLVQKKKKFLFIKRNGVWDIPKGKLEKGEKIKKAAIREIVEECGVNPPKIKQHLIDTYHTYEYKGKLVLKRTYWYWMTANEKDTKLVPQKEEGITKVSYLKAKKFKKIKRNTYASIIEVMKALENRL
ncbi:MAG: NUDIX hydrolase [Putridiphycobacter sp.]